LGDFGRGLGIELDLIDAGLVKIYFLLMYVSNSLREALKKPFFVAHLAQPGGGSGGVQWHNNKNHFSKLLYSGFKHFG